MFQRKYSTVGFTALYAAFLSACGGTSQEWVDDSDAVTIQAPALQTPRSYHSSITLDDGRVLVVGGYSSGGAALRSAEVFDASSGQWSPAGNMSVGRVHHTAIKLNDGRVLIAGGISGTTVLASTELWDPATGAFVSGPSLNQKRYMFAGARMQDGRVLVMGGLHQVNTTELFTAEIYDPSTNAWSFAQNMQTVRRNNLALALSDGTVITLGGSAFGVSNGSKLVERYDPATDQWSSAGFLQQRRSWSQAAQLADGRVLVVGGYQNTAELWDPSSETSASTGSTVGTHKSGARLVIVGNEAVVVGGLDGSNPTAQVERFEPGTQTWSSIDLLQTARGHHGLSLLNSGDLLVSGGSSGRGATFGSVEKIQLQSSCHVGDPGGWSYCTDDCPCDVGEGDCDSDSQCAPGLVCHHDVGLSYGYASSAMDVCDMPTVGGDCHNGSNGGWSYCTASCPCDVGEGDCDSDSQCMAGLICRHNVGAQYGFSSAMDICEAP